MTYFSKLPLTSYELSSKTSVVRDITRRAAFSKASSPYENLYELYTISDGETPESVGVKFYDSAFYHWVILLFNEIHNPYFDWPVDQITLDYFCQKKYGRDTDGEFLMIKVRHYELANLVVGDIVPFVSGFPWVPPTVPVDAQGNVIQLAYPVTFYDYEQGINDAKRVIKIMSPEILGDFIREYEKAVNV